MKMRRILSLLLVVVFILLSFSTILVYAEDEDTSAPATAESPEGEEGTEGGDEEENAEPFELDGVMMYPAASMTLVDPAIEDNELVLGAAANAASGRGVSVFTIEAKPLFAVEAANLVGVCTYSSEERSMSLLESYSSETQYAYYSMEKNNLGEDRVGETLYVLLVSQIAEADIAALPDMDPPTRLQWKIDNRGLFESPEQRVRAMTKYFEDSDVILYADDELAEIAVYKKAENQYYFSSPYDYRRVGGISSADVKKKLASLVELKYYDNSAKLKEVYSYSDAVEKTEYADPDDPDSFDNIQFTAEAIDNGVRFNLEIGTKSVDTLLPYAAEAENFKTKVLDPVEELAAQENETAKLAKRKLNAYYRFYSYADLTPSMQRSLIANYPGLKNHDFYILRSGVMNREKAFLSDFIKISGLYTWADYNNDLEISGYVPEDVALACFDVKIDFTIENGDLVVDMPTDNITYDTQNFTLAEVTLMHYFGCGKYDQDGFVLIPDGSGCVIKFNNDGNKNENIGQTVYGDDYSLSTVTRYVKLSQTSYMPVYGLKADKQGYVAILEKGDALAKVSTDAGGTGKPSPYESVYTTFTYKTVQAISYADGSKADGSFTYFNKNTYTGGFRMRFVMLSGKKSEITYVDMAKAYRQYLLDHDKLTEKVTTANSNVPVVLETLGLIDKKTSFYGIIYDKKIPMTTFSDAQSMLDELIEGGVKNVSLRYRGWMNGGLNYSVPSKLSIESKLGGKSGFSALTSYMADHQFDLFPEVDFCVVRRDGVLDGYNTTSDAPKMTDRTTVTMTPRNELDNVMEIKKSYFAISPAVAGKYFKSFFGKYTKYKNNAISLGTVGDMLYSDFSNKKNATNRQQAVDNLSKNVADYVNGKGINSIMVEGGNAYTYGYATDIVDIPLCDSNSFQADYAVPFMQIVLHGHIRYSGTALNLSDDITDTILKSAEYGANLHFTLSMKNTRELKETVYSNYYTIDFDTWKSDVTTLYAKFNDVFATLQDQEIEDHTESKDVAGVFITTYANGTRVAVNYNTTDVTVEGKTIAAQDFAVL